MAVMRPSHAGAQLIDDFGNRIEAVNFRVGSKKLPTRMFTALYADVDDNKRLGQQALGHHPLGEPRVGVMVEVHMPGILWMLGAAVYAPGVEEQGSGRVRLQQHGSAKPEDPDGAC